MNTTGENEQGLRKILDMTRMISVVLLLLHFYHTCYGVFIQWGLRSDLSDRLMNNIYKTGLFSNFTTAKLLSISFLVISLIGARGKKEERIKLKNSLYTI